jgi:MFS family permease
MLTTSLCAINLFANSAYSSIAPFYPQEADKKGVPVGLIGITFASYSIAMAVFSPIFARLLTTKGSRFVLTLGCLCEGISMLIFGVLYYVQSPAWFASLSFLCRFLEGFGNGCLNSGCKSWPYSP